MLVFFTIESPKRRFGNLSSKALSPTSWETTITQMTNCISGFHGASGTTKMKVTKATIAMPFTAPGSNDRPPLNFGGFTWETVIAMDMRWRMATMRMQMRKMMPCKAMMNQCRMWCTEGRVSMTC
jgi:hypothetical protein